MIKTLAVYAKAHLKYIIIAPILMIGDVLCEMLMPLLMSRIVDVGIANSDVGYTLRIGGLMVVLALMAITLGVLNMFCSTRASIGFGAQLRSALFKKIQEFSFANIDKFNVASLVTRTTNDVNALQGTVLMALRMMIRAPFMLIIALTLAFSINAKLSLILCIALPILACAIWFIISKAGKMFTQMQQKVDALNGSVQENLLAIRVVKAFVRQTQEKQKFKNANDSLMRATIRAASLGVLMQPVMALIMNSAVIAVLWFGGHMVGEGHMASGQLISFISYITQTLMSLMMFSMMFMNISRAKASGARVIEVLSETVDVDDSADALPIPAQDIAGSVEFKNVSFKYNADSDAFVLKDIAFNVKPGEIVAIVGATGSAKTTLINLIPRLYDVTQGAIYVGGKDVRDYQLHDLREAVGVVPQNNNLFTGSVRENMLWGDKNATEEQIMEAAKHARAHEFIMAMPQGYDTELSQGGVNVSGGQKQRLCIARALIKKPKILILDDSMSAVDTGTEIEIRKALRENYKNTTIILIAQRITSIADADKIIILDDGMIAGMGTHEQLLETSAIYQDIVHSQIGGEALAS